MTDHLTIALAQINPTVGDIPGNIRRIEAARAGATGADLIVFPELTISGYPPEDLVLKDAFLDAVAMGIAELAAGTADGGPAMLVGAPWRQGGERRNATHLLDGGRVIGTVLKHHLRILRMRRLRSCPVTVPPERVVYCVCERSRL